MYWSMHAWLWSVAVHTCPVHVHLHIKCGFFSSQLNRLISQFFLRRTQEVNHQYLLPKGTCRPHGHVRMYMYMYVSMYVPNTETHGHSFVQTHTVEAVVFCSMSPLQTMLYSHLTRKQIARMHSRHTNDMSQHLVCIGALKKICNSPSLLYTAAQANSDQSDVRVELSVLMCTQIIFVSWSKWTCITWKQIMFGWPDKSEILG